MRQLLKSLLICSLLLPLPAAAAVFTVNSTSSSGDVSPGDGICSTSSSPVQCTLPAALDEANALAGTDTIILTANTYSRGGFINDGVIITGAGPSTTIIDGSFIDYFTINTDQPVSISGLTIRDVSGTGSYGIYVGENADVTLTDIEIRDNDGPAIIGHPNGFNQLTIENSLFEGNQGAGLTSRFGGALYFQGSGNVFITDTTIRENTATFAGGIYLKGTTLTLTRTTVSDNQSTAASNVNGGYGGGGIIVSEDGSLTLINSTISGNEAVSSGGGIVIDDGSVALYSSTITDNRADSDSDLAGSGGGIIASSSTFSTTNVLTLRNSIIAQNFAGLNVAIDCSSTNASITSFGYNLIGNGTDTDCLITPAAGDQFGTVFSIDPLLAPLAENGGDTETHLLTTSSPALDAGNPAGCDDAAATALDVDQRGFERPLDSGSGTLRCDIGAVEMYGLPIADAGSEQVVQYGENVILSGDESTALQGIAVYSWAENPSPSVTLTDASSSIASFTAPSTAGDLVFELTITDNSANMDTDSVTITVNAPPVADAGPDAGAHAGAGVVLDGSASFDDDGSIDSYSWMQSAGTTVTLSDADTSTAGFTAAGAVGEILTFELTVTDDTGAWHTDSVDISITVNQAAIDTIESVLKAVKKYSRKSAIKKHRKSKKFLKRSKKHLDSALALYTAGDAVGGLEEVGNAIADMRKVKKMKSKFKKLIKKLNKIE